MSRFPSDASEVSFNSMQRIISASICTPSRTDWIISLCVSNTSPRPLRAANGERASNLMLLVSISAKNPDGSEGSSFLKDSRDSGNAVGCFSCRAGHTRHVNGIAAATMHQVGRQFLAGGKRLEGRGWTKLLAGLTPQRRQGEFASPVSSSRGH